VSYFDQSAIFLYSTLGAIGSLVLAPMPATANVQLDRALIPQTYGHGQRNRLPNV
jgi:hypothetical protein